MKNIFGINKSNEIRGSQQKAAPSAETQDETEESAIEPQKVPDRPVVKMVPKKVLCTRCGGDGLWHNPATGVRALTSTKPALDPKGICPRCKSFGHIFIQITEGQAKAEKVANDARVRADKTAAKARDAAEEAEKIAKQAEAKLEKFCE